jgi:RimJ/RimL family protein N-acetyltransferase
MAFNELRMYRIWVDIPEYNEAARALFTHLGFVHEGTLRKSRPHEGSRYDSVVMGMLSAEYAQRSREGSTEARTV